MVQTLVEKVVLSDSQSPALGPKLKGSNYVFPISNFFPIATALFWEFCTFQSRPICPMAATTPTSGSTISISIYSTTIRLPSQLSDFYSSVAGRRSSTYAGTISIETSTLQLLTMVLIYPPTSTLLFTQLWELVDKSDATCSHGAWKYAIGAVGG